MLLNDVKNKLEEIDSNVHYGLMAKEPKDVPVWDYIVFNRIKLRQGQDKNSLGDLFQVHIVRENFIPEGLDAEVLTKMRSIPGVRPTGDDGEFNYTKKPGTDTVVEMLTLTFVRARK